MLAAVLLAHVALVGVELVVRAADIAGRQGVAVGLAQGRRGAVLQRNGHHPEAARLLLQLAARSVRVAVGAADRGQGFLLRGAVRAVVAVGLGLQDGAGTDVGQLDAASGIEGVFIFSVGEAYSTVQILFFKMDTSKFLI